MQRNRLNTDKIKFENLYVGKLVDLIGFLEDVTEEELQLTYGISLREYLFPSAETIAKVSSKLSNEESTKHR